jgi:hypothetical protein
MAYSRQPYQQPDRHNRNGLGCNINLPSLSASEPTPHALAMLSSSTPARWALGSIYRSGRCKDWLKFKNPDAPAVRREAEEDWGR